MNEHPEIAVACANIRLRVDQLVARAQREMGGFVYYFKSRSPLEMHWHFPQAVWLASICFNRQDGSGLPDLDAPGSFQIDVARVSTSGDGIKRQSRQMISVEEVRLRRSPSCHHAFVGPIEACLDYFRFDGARESDEPPISFGPSPLCACANDWSRIAPAFKFDSPGGSVAGLAELAAELGHEPGHEPRRAIGVTVEDSRPVPGSDLHEVKVQVFGPAFPPPPAPAPRTCEEEPPRRINFREFL